MNDNDILTAANRIIGIHRAEALAFPREACRDFGSLRDHMRRPLPENGPSDSPCFG
jgi:hypothetical protein